MKKDASSKTTEIPCQVCSDPAHLEKVLTAMQLLNRLRYYLNLIKTSTLSQNQRHLQQYVGTIFPTASFRVWTMRFMGSNPSGVLSLKTSCVPNGNWSLLRRTQVLNMKDANSKQRNAFVSPGDSRFIAGQFARFESLYAVKIAS